MLAINPDAHAYTWATTYEPLKGLAGPYFVQYSYTGGSNTPVGSAVRDGMLCSVIYLSGANIPEYGVNEDQITELLEFYPDVKMIMTDAPEALIESLDRRGLR